MNADEIVALSDQELNEMCAESVMQWKEGTEFDTWGDNSETMFMREKYQTLVGIPFQLGDMIQKGVWSHQWEKYSPVTDLVQAFELLTHLHETQQWEFKIWTVNLDLFTVQIGGIAGSCDKSLTRAIVYACILAAKHGVKNET